jgi:hypothetical protein
MLTPVAHKNNADNSLANIKNSQNKTESDEQHRNEQRLCNCVWIVCNISSSIQLIGKLGLRINWRLWKQIKQRQFIAWPNVVANIVSSFVTTIAADFTSE